MKCAKKCLNDLKNLCLIGVCAQLVIACSQIKQDQLTTKESTESFTSVITQQSATREIADWGVFHKYFEGTTIGTKNVLSGTAEIKAGMEIHPPHTHEEEEYLMVLEGEGTWTINGESFPAKAGDMLYAKPWDSHGIRNTGDKTLKFVFWKWNARP